MTFDPDAPQNETDRSDAVNNLPEAVADAPPLRDENMDEQNPDAVILANPQWGSVAMLSMAASMTESAASAVVMAANYNVFRARDLHDEFNMTNGGGTLENFARKALEGVDKDDPDSEDNDKDDEGLTYADVAEEREERRHEREVWAETDHTFAGQTMTGEEWQSMKKWFDDPDNVAGWEQSMMAETGQSLAEVRQTGGKMRRFYDLVDKQAKGQTLTTEEKTEFQKLSNDTAVQTGVEIQKQQMDADRRLSTKAEVKAQTTEVRADSSVERIDLIAARANLNAESLTPIYNAVAAEPMKPKPGASAPAPATSPVEIAAVSAPPRPVAALNANLDMG